MRKRGLFISVIIFVSVLSLTYLLINPAFNYMSGYLSKSEEVKANILIVEGWLPDHALEMAYNEFHIHNYEYIVTTGIISYESYFKFYNNGYLIFYTQKLLSGMGESGTHSIEVDAFSELGGGNRAHFNLFINDSLVADYIAEIRKKIVSFSWKGNLKEIDSIMVQFDNDSLGDFEDRNLFVKEIKIDDKITIPYLNNSEYDMLKLDGKQRFINNYNSNAEFARYRLLLMGIDSSQIVATSGESVKINRTLASALAFRDWLKKTNVNIKGINIISQGAHARRTLMTYNKILDEKYKIGIISLPENKNQFYSKRSVFKTLRETLGIIYYWFILIPY